MSGNSASIDHDAMDLHCAASLLPRIRVAAIPTAICPTLAMFLAWQTFTR
jgi:hypothetical protein